MQRRCRGRPRCARRVEIASETRGYIAVPQKEAEPVYITLEELEAIRLVDLEDLEQEAAANKMGISRKAFWLDLQRARKKIADALVNGKNLLILGSAPAGENEKEEMEVKEMWFGRWPGRGPFRHLPPWQRPGWLYGRGACWWLWPYWAQYGAPPPTIPPETEKAILEERLKILEKEIESIKARLAELK